MMISKSISIHKLQIHSQTVMPSYVVSFKVFKQVVWVRGIISHESAIFFPGFFFYVYIESPNPKNPEGPTPP